MNNNTLLLIIIAGGTALLAEAIQKEVLKAFNVNSNNGISY